jgi:hypothetical protein
MIDCSLLLTLSWLSLTAYLKGDEVKPVISNKSKNIVRKKMFLMLGAEMGLEEKVGVNLITNSLAEAD